MPSTKLKDTPVKKAPLRTRWLESGKANKDLWKEVKKDLSIKVEPESLVASPIVSSCGTPVHVDFNKLPAGVPRDAVDDSEEAANIYDDYIQSKQLAEAVANSNVRATNARIRAKDSLDDFDVTVNSAVPTRTLDGVRAELGEVIQELDDQVVEMLRCGEAFLFAEHHFNIIAQDVEKLCCQMEAATSQQTNAARNKCLVNALKSRDMLYKAMSRIRKMANEQHKRNYAAQVALLPAGSDKHSRANKKRRSREKKPKKE